MRTKTLLLTAALTAAGAATSMAQVYSVNMVGYINASVPAGFSMLANHLNHTPDNKITTLFATPPDGTQVYAFNATTDTYELLQFIDGAWEGDNLDMTLNPGQGVFINPPSAFTTTFVGEVQLSSSVSVASGFSIISSALPQSLPLDGAPNDGVPAAAVGLGFPVAEGDQVYQFNNASGTYTFNQFVDGAWEGDGGGSPPTIGISESFFLNNAGATKNWSRNFVVGVD